MLLLAAVLLAFVTEAAAAPYLVKEINTEVTIGSNPSSIIEANGTVYFAADDPAHGRELWKTDGTAAGTVRITDINAGAGSSHPSPWIAIGPTLLFTACSANANGYDFTNADCELWKTDGTPEGAARLADITPGLGSAHPALVTVMNGKALFIATEGSGERKLWTTDGTVEGTGRSIDPPAALDGGHLAGLTNVNGTLFFVGLGTNGDPGPTLWKSDGTASGTAPVAGVPASSEIGDLIRVGSTLFFTLCTRPTCELWKTDGTAQGTAFVAGMGPSFGDDDTRRPPFGLKSAALTNANDVLFFHPNSGGCELWTSDGTTAGTVMLVGDGESCPHDSVVELASTSDGVVFRACPPDYDCELWKSDGTPENTVQLVDIFPGRWGSDPSLLTTVGDTVFFAASEPDVGLALWKSDGTPAGTSRLRPFSQLSELSAVGGTLFFQGCDLTNGCELWRSDGTTDGTMRVADIYPNDPSGDSYPEKLTRVGDLLYFHATSVAGKQPQLWRSDGTDAGTFTLGDHSLYDTELVDVNGTTFFTQHDVNDGFSLWRTDGTLQDTLLLKSNPTWYPSYLTNVNGTLFFRVYNSGAHHQLWKSDGTPEGTVQFGEADMYGTGSQPPVSIGSIAYFVGCAPDCELWRTDLTRAGTYRVADINPGSSASSNPIWLTDVGGTLFFVACEPSTGCELWKSDGTAAGTTRVVDLTPGSKDAEPRMLREVNGLLFFKHGTYYEAPQLWRSDGTAAGTMLLANVRSEYLDGVVIDGTFFFGGCDDSLVNCRLWKSNGTAATTVPLFAPVESIYAPDNLMNVGGTLLFTTTTPTGYSVWTSDGTPEHTAVVATVGGDNYRSPSWTAVDDKLFYLAKTPEHGAELWALAPDGPPVEPGARCDDGNRLDGDCCSSTGRFERVGSPCGASDACMQGRCDGAGTCQQSNVSGPCDDGDPCTAGDTCANGTCRGTEDFTACLDEFLCRKVDRATKWNPAPRLMVSDRFERGIFALKRATQLCAPASATRAPIIDAPIALTAYPVVPSGPIAGPLIRRRLGLTNQFGSIDVDVQRAETLLVPTASSPTRTPVAPIWEGHEAEHYKCYKAKPVRGGPKGTASSVTIDDAFTTPLENFTVMKPVRVCVPAAANGKLVKRVERFLMCYRVKAVQSTRASRTRRFVSNQLGSGRVNVGKEEELCVPSTRTP